MAGDGSRFRCSAVRQGRFSDHAGSRSDGPHHPHIWRPANTYYSVSPPTMPAMDRTILNVVTLGGLASTLYGEPSSSSSRLSLSKRKVCTQPRPTYRKTEPRQLYNIYRCLPLNSMSIRRWTPHVLVFVPSIQFIPPVVSWNILYNHLRDFLQCSPVR